MTDTIQNILSQNEKLLDDNQQLQKLSLEHLIQDRNSAEERRQKANQDVSDSLREQRQVDLEMFRNSQTRFSSIFGKQVRASRVALEARSDSKQISRNIGLENRKLDQIRSDKKQIPFKRLRLQQEENQRIQEEARNEANKMFSLRSPQLSTLERLNKLKN
jgi:hypothetical protein